MVRRRTNSCLLCLLGVAALLGGTLAGCGNSRTPVPRFGAPAPPNGVRLLPLPAGGVLLQVPRTWVRRPVRHRRCWPRSPPAPRRWRCGAIAAARPPPIGRGRPGAGPGARCWRAARRRDPTLQPIRVAVITLAGQGAVELDAFEHINGQLRRVRSVHVYQPGRELVLDAYAPPAIFHAVDHAVFSPVKRSLRFLGPGAA